MKHTKTLAVLTAILAVVSCGHNKSSQDDAEQREAWVESTLSQMTLEEKVAILHAQSKFCSAGVPRLGVPEVWMSDGPHGVRPEVLWDEWDAAGWTNDSCTAFPALTALAATWDRDLARLQGRSTGEEARYRKKNVLLGPGVNIHRHPMNGRNFEYMGEDPYLSSQMVVPFVQGVQSNGVATCVKHFALNEQETERHNYTAIIGERALREIYLRPFQAAVQEGHAWSIMGSYNKYNDQYMCHNHRMLVDILKGEWGFDGAVVSDWGGCESTDEAITNGLDMEFGTSFDGIVGGVSSGYDNYHLAVPYLRKIESGEVGQDELNDKCRRVLRLMYRTRPDGYSGRFTCPDHYAAARKIGADGIVLLRNEGGLLPIKSDAQKKILVLGENAIKPMTVGGGSSSLKVQHEISILNGISEAFPNAQVSYERAYQGSPTGGYNAYGEYDLTDPRSSEQLLKDAIEATKDADYVIFVGGLNKDDGQDAEGADRQSYELPYGQNEVIEALAAVRSDLIVVNISGNAVAMPWAESVGAILQDWYLGSEAGHSLADVLSGAVCPSGKLPYSMPVKFSDSPIQSVEQWPGVQRPTDGVWEVKYSEGIYVGYRWYDKKGIETQFPFGYGLSYTTFDYGQPKASSKTMGETLTLSIPITNSGSCDGAEVVELYISAPSDGIDRPVKELKGFDKVYLQAGQSGTATMELKRSDLGRWDEELGDWVVDPGEYTALFASSSVDIHQSLTFTVK